MTTKKKKRTPINGDITVRQYFYFKNQMDKEYMIKALERTYKQTKESVEFWDEIMEHKNINF